VPDTYDNLPLLPLTSGVVLPGMVLQMTLETDEARSAVDAAGAADSRLVLVPHIEGRYSSVGVVAEILEIGELAGGYPRGRHSRGAPRPRRCCRTFDGKGPLGQRRGRAE